MNKSLLAIWSMLLVGSFSLHASEIDEDELFSGAQTLVDSSEYIQKGTDLGAADSTTVDFSGEVSSYAVLNGSRDFFDGFHRNQLASDASLLGSFLLDIRLPRNFKSFGNMEFTYSPEKNSADYSLKELFLDMNINRRVYIRSGKQVLQWGRCNLWNPTDLVNVERESFLPTIGSREGTFGIRAHVPFGVAWNLYGFVDMNDMSAVDSLAAAAKAEYLAGNTEMALGVWGKPGRDPVFGFDVSTSVMDFQIAGEVSLSKGTNYNSIATENGMPRFDDLGEDLVTRASVSATRLFDFLDVNDRITASAEFYFNQGGDKGNIFEEPALIMLRDALLSSDSSGMRDTAAYVYSTYYEPNSHSRFYGAFFTSMSRFIHQDLTLSANALFNLDQGCAVVSTSLDYRNLHNFSMGLTVNSIFGPENTEFTLFKEAFTLQFKAGMGF
ncbi:MAG: hypothetical protein ACLFQB_14100 [Chitinispirillaceae bacterium]